MIVTFGAIATLFLEKNNKFRFCCKNATDTPLFDADLS
jgi:hypothetical protein